MECNWLANGICTAKSGKWKFLCDGLECVFQKKRIKYKYIWGNNLKRATLKGRYCVILAVQRANSVIIQFLDNNQMECVSRRALRRTIKGG